MVFWLVGSVFLYFDLILPDFIKKFKIQKEKIQKPDYALLRKECFLLVRFSLKIQFYFSFKKILLDCQTNDYEPNNFCCGNYSVTINQDRDEAKSEGNAFNSRVRD